MDVNDDGDFDDEFVVRLHMNGTFKSYLVIEPEMILPSELRGWADDLESDGYFEDDGLFYLGEDNPVVEVGGQHWKWTDLDGWIMTDDDITEGLTEL